MAEPIDDQTLMAFADGVLEEPAFSEVAAAIETDPDLAERLEQLVLGKDLARAAYAPLVRPVPSALEKSVSAAIERAEARPAAANDNDWRRLAAAACLATIVAGPLGYLLAAQNEAPTGGTAIGIDSVLAQTMATAPSGQTTMLPDGREFVAVVSFRDQAGNLCREFETIDAQLTTGVACRADDAWTLRMAVTSERPGSADYFAASGLPAIDAYLGEIGAGAPLSPEEEAAALAQAD